MSALNDLLAKIGEGKIDVNAAVPEFLRILKTSEPDRPPGVLNFMQTEERAEAGTPDATDTFTQVSAAWIADEITDEQYQVLYNAVLAGVRTEDSSKAEVQPAAEAPAEDIEDPDA